MTLTYDHPSSNHAPSEPTPAAPAPAAEAPAAVPGEPRTFNYDKTNQPLPKGTPAEHLPEAVREFRAQREGWHSPQNDYRDSGLEEALKFDQSLTDAERAATAAEYKELFADHDLNASEAREIVSLTREVTTNPPTEATEQQWQRDAWASLVSTYGGEKGAKEALELAQRLVARDPRIAAVLDASRLGNHPKVIALMAAKARSQRVRGRLK